MIIRTAATDAFKLLPNVDEQNVQLPLHQATVEPSNGFGGVDASTNGPEALQFEIIHDGRAILGRQDGSTEGARARYQRVLPAPHHRRDR